LTLSFSIDYIRINRVLIETLSNIFGAVETTAPPESTTKQHTLTAPPENTTQQHTLTTPQTNTTPLKFR
uniref:hypothetical protein n=1 Tax=Prevotella sp. TaxID=59823 RepID=UPI004025997D